MRTREDVIARMNWLGAQRLAVLNRLADACIRTGGHEPTGEVFTTANPIHTCFYCGARFQIEAAKDGGE